MVYAAACLRRSAIYSIIYAEEIARAAIGSILWDKRIREASEVHSLAVLSICMI